MNELIIGILKKIQNYLEQSTVSKDNGSGVVTIHERKNGMFIRVIAGLIITGLYILMLVLLFNLYFDRYTGIRLFSYYEYILLILFISLQTLLLVYMIIRIRKNDCNIISSFYTLYFPLYFSSFTLLGIIFGKDTMVDGIGYFNFILISLVIIYPFLSILSSFFKKLEIPFFQRVKNFFLAYNLGFFFLFSLNIALISIGWDIDFLKPWSTAIIEIISSYHRSFYFFEGMLYILMSFFLITSGVFSLNTYFQEAQKSRKSLNIGLTTIFGVFLFSLIPLGLDSFYSMQIERASEILTREGQNAVGYNNAHVFLLDRAFYSKIKNRESIDRELFQKIYDSTPEEYFGEKIADFTDSRSSFGTNSSKIGEKANVILSLAEIENRIQTGSIFQTLETTYRFNFENASNTNQEVIIHFEAPTKYSVVSSMRLGLDLELIGQIAPKGAARKLYEDSLRRNTDPALIEKIGLNSYNLRVFPIPSKQDQKTQGRQLVEVKILTPILSDKQKIAYTPKFSFINLRFDARSGIISKIYNDSRIIKEDTVRKEEIEIYLAHEHFMEFNAPRNYRLGEMCQESSNLINSFLEANPASYTSDFNSGKVSVLFDNSLSVERNKSNVYYGDIYAALKNYQNTLHDIDLYSYNFDVNKLLSPRDIKFYGYSNIDRTIDYMIRHKIMDERIILVTDDESFNFTTLENKTRDYNSLMTNQISVIKIGDKIKSYKPEINNILSATDGDIYQVRSKDDINAVIGKIYGTPKGENFTAKICSGEIYDENSQKIRAGYFGNSLLSKIRSESGWQKVAEIQTYIAKKYNIVNQFNSFIALETIKQQEDLERYSNEESKYDATYNNNEGGIGGNIRKGIVIGSNVPEIILMSEMSTKSTGINFGGDNISQSTQGSSRYNDYYPERYNDQFNGKTELSLFGLLMFLVYLVEFYGLMAFVVNYVKSKPETKI